MLPRRPPKPMKNVAAHAPSKQRFNFTLNAVQRVQVEIIDWKRHSIRCLLIIAYATLVHLLIYLTIFGYHLIQKLEWFQVAFSGFLFDIGLYFFGSGAALKAITFVWLSIRIISIIINIVLFFLGTFKASSFNNRILPLPLPNCTEDNSEIDHACHEVEPVTAALFMKPFILPPVSLVCVILASLSAYKAVYLIPHKLAKGEVDAKLLEPYKTYDFYVGRNIPRIPGYDDDIHFNMPIAKYFADLDTEDEDDDHDTENTDIIGKVSGGGAGGGVGGKKRKRPPVPVDLPEDQTQALHQQQASEGGGDGAKKRLSHHLPHQVHHPPPRHHEMRMPAEEEQQLHPPPFNQE